MYGQFPIDFSPIRFLRCHFWCYLRYFWILTSKVNGEIYWKLTVMFFVVASQRRAKQPSSTTRCFRKSPLLKRGTRGWWTWPASYGLCHSEFWNSNRTWDHGKLYSEHVSPLQLPYISIQFRELLELKSNLCHSECKLKRMVKPVEQVSI